MRKTNQTPPTSNMEENQRMISESDSKTGKKFKRDLKPTNYSTIEKFDLGVKQLRLYKEMEDSGIPLSPKDKENEQKILQWCWNNIKRYGFDLAHKSIDNNFNSSKEDYKPVESHLWLAFKDCILRYESSKGALTTFFRPYFQAAVRQYIGERWSNLTEYDAANARLVRAAADFFEAENIVYTPQMLAEKTGLSINVVHNTIRIMEQANYVDVDEYYNLPSAALSPEEEVVKKEADSLLWKLLDTKLTQREKVIFLSYVNPNEKRCRSYGEVAKMTHLPIQEVKTTCNKVRIRLQHDPDILELYRGIRFETKKRKKSVLSLNEDTDFSSIIESYLE